MNFNKFYEVLKRQGEIMDLNEMLWQSCRVIELHFLKPVLHWRQAQAVLSREN